MSQQDEPEYEEEEEEQDNEEERQEKEDGSKEDGGKELTSERGRADFTASAEEDAKRQEMADKFTDLAKEIETADENIKVLLSNKITRKQKRYAKMTEGEEESFLKSLETVNKNLGKAQAMLDAYVEFDKSTPEFKNFYNKFFQLYEFITIHRRGTFYNHNAERNEYLYPLIDITTKFGGLSFLFARLCGVLYVSAEYIKDSIYLTARSPVDMGGRDPQMGYGGGYYPHSYAPTIRPDYYGADDRWGSQKERKETTRDIGDRFDRS